MSILLALSGVASASPHTIEASPHVMVLPFRAVGDVGKYTWIGDGVEQALIVRASQPGITVLTSPPHPAVAGVAVDPVAQAKAGGASVVVTGSYQILNDTIRLSGQVIDVGTAQAVGGLSKTGPIRDLFSLEDDLSQQLETLLDRNPGPVEGGPVADTTPAPLAQIIHEGL